MAMNSGYDRYEGLAYFGYDPEGEGYEAAVVIGENFIEIRNLAEQTLSIWAPGAYHCNDHEIPERAYFSGNEWLAPRDEELRVLLDQYMEVSPEQNTSPKEKSPMRWGVYALILLGLLIIAYFTINMLTPRLLNTAIRSELDRAILANYPSEMKICNPELELNVHRDITHAQDGTDFMVLANLGANYARLPSGRLVIDGDFAQKLSNEQTLIALLQLAKKKNADNDPAKDLIGKLGFVNKLRFLSFAEIVDADLREAWKKHIQSDEIDYSVFMSLDKKIGDFQRISQLHEKWPQSDEYPQNPAEITLMDDDWLALVTLCKEEG